MFDVQLDGVEPFEVDIDALEDGKYNISFNAKTGKYTIGVMLNCKYDTKPFDIDVKPGADPTKTS